MQTKNEIMLIELGKWVFLSAGILGAFFSFVAWFLVPGVMDLNRLVVAGLFASLATNAFLLSGLFFRGSAEHHSYTLTSVLRTPPIIISGLFLLAFILVTATAPWWAKH